MKRNINKISYTVLSVILIGSSFAYGYNLFSEDLKKLQLFTIIFVILSFENVFEAGYLIYMLDNLNKEAVSSFPFNIFYTYQEFIGCLFIFPKIILNFRLRRIEELEQLYPNTAEILG